MKSMIGINVSCLKLTFVLRSVRQVRVPLFAIVAIFIASIFGKQRGLTPA